MKGNNKKSKIVAIGSMDNLSKEDLSISIPMSTIRKSIVNVAMIGADAYGVAYKLKAT